MDVCCRYYVVRALYSAYRTSIMTFSVVYTVSGNIHVFNRIFVSSGSGNRYVGFFNAAKLTSSVTDTVFRTGRSRIDVYIIVRNKNISLCSADVASTVERTVRFIYAIGRNNGGLLALFILALVNGKLELGNLNAYALPFYSIGYCYNYLFYSLEVYIFTQIYRRFFVTVGHLYVGKLYVRVFLRNVAIIVFYGFYRKNTLSALIEKVYHKRIPVGPDVKLASDSNVFIIELYGSGSSGCTRCPDRTDITVYNVLDVRVRNFSPVLTGIIACCRSRFYVIALYNRRVVRISCNGKIIRI